MDALSALEELLHDARAAALGAPGGVAGRLLLKLQRSVADGPELLVFDDEADELTLWEPADGQSRGVA